VSICATQQITSPYDIVHFLNFAAKGSDLNFHYPAYDYHITKYLTPVGGVILQITNKKAAPERATMLVEHPATIATLQLFHEKGLVTVVTIW